MRRYFILIFILIVSMACWGGSNPLVKPTSTITHSPPTSTATLIPPTPTSTVSPTFSPTPIVATSTPPFLASPTPDQQSFTVYYHPDDVLYVGDQVSIEVVSPPGMDMKDANLQVQIDPPSGPSLGPVNFAAWGIQGRNEANLLWGWDTRNQTPGTHSLSFSIQPQGYRWTEQVSLLPTSEMPSSQAEAKWASTQSKCCAIFYITNTASERDLTALATAIDEQARMSIEEMGSTFTEPITITVVPRLLGHGGFTSSEISVSYLDRNYAANTWSLVVHHEMIHAIDGHLGGDFRPTIFVEGLAVYMSGGHYKLEPLMPRAATLLENNLNWYIPLKTLADDFYASQHEIGYLEGASLIEYMVKAYGWQAFSTFYRDIHINQGENQSDAINKALNAHFSISFDQLEQDFLAALKNQTDTSAWVDDVRLTVTYFDTMRRYQQMLDPSAYFRTAWLLDNKTMRERKIVADYLRHPHSPVNLALETILITASQLMSDGKYQDASQTLQVITLVLDAIEHGSTDPFSVSKISADYLSIATTLQEQGYEVQAIQITADSAQATTTTSIGPDLVKLNLNRSGGRWSEIP